jgi:hypothetical protein
MPAKPDPSKTSTNKKAIDDIFKRKSTLKTGGEDRKSTLKTGGEDRKSTLKTSGEDGNLKNPKKHQLSKRVNDCENIFQNSTPGSSPSKHTTSGPRRRTEEGFRIFTVDELRIGQGEGDTPLCPFDCDCCF